MKIANVSRMFLLKCNSELLQNYIDAHMKNKVMHINGLDLQGLLPIEPGHNCVRYVLP